MYVIKHHNKFQSDMPSHIREMAKESYLNIFAKCRLGVDADARVIALALWDLSPGELKVMQTFLRYTIPNTFLQPFKVHKR